jgi:glucose-1-phosphate cytidylyltransferase
VKAVILAGGLGTRLAEETSVRPKPMVEIGGMPILWHIMKLYSAHGVDEFIVCLGYKGYLIKEFFANYYLHTCDVTFDIAQRSMEVHHSTAEPWRVTLVDTGDDTMTGGRIKRVLPYVGDEPFCMTYGDGLADIDIGALLAFHRDHGLEATVTGVQPPGRFGALEVAEGSDRVTGFLEKVWEQEPMRGLAEAGQMATFRHTGFWRGMDTLRDRGVLEDLWASGRAPWRTW